MDEGSDFRSDELAGFPEPPAPPGHGPRRRVHPLTLVAVAVAGATIGVAGVMIADFSSSTPAAGGTPSSSPTAQAPSGGANPGGAYQGGGPSGLPPLTGNGSGLRVMLSGRVVAVSATSITIGGRGPSVTAKITKATQFAGKVHGIGGVKVGDQVSATFSGSSASSLTASAIEDPGRAA